MSRPTQPKIELLESYTAWNDEARSEDFTFDEAWVDRGLSLIRQLTPKIKSELLRVEIRGKQSQLIQMKRTQA